MSSKELLSLCSTEGCYLPAHRRGMCSKHFNKWRYLTYFKPLRLRQRRARRSRLLHQWLSSRGKGRFSNRRARQGTLPPLTPAQQRVYDHELSLLIRERPPRTQLEASHLQSQASVWARAGGKAVYQHLCAIEARKAGWRRKWLREGSYDPTLLDTLSLDTP